MRILKNFKNQKEYKRYIMLNSIKDLCGLLTVCPIKGTEEMCLTERCMLQGE